MIDELVDYIGKNSGSNVTRSSIKKFTETIRNLQNWDFDTSNRNENINSVSKIKKV